jgi:cytochrome c5
MRKGVSLAQQTAPSKSPPASHSTIIQRTANTLPIMSRTHYGVAVMLYLTTLLSGCGPGTDAGGQLKMPTFDDPVLAEGRAVWMGTCRACHLLGVAGAPAVTDYPNWEPRIAKGMQALYQGPLLGIRGDDGQYKMPPRAGNDRLSDTQIRRAADYMVAAVKYLHAEHSGG